MKRLDTDDEKEDLVRFILKRTRNLLGLQALRQRGRRLLDYKAVVWRGHFRRTRTRGLLLEN